MPEFFQHQFNYLHETLLSPDYWWQVCILVLALAAFVNSRIQVSLETRSATTVPVLTALAAVRFSVYLLRKAFTINPLLRSSENLLAGLIWLGVIFHLLGWLPAVLEMLDSVAVTLGDTRVSVLSVFNVMILIAVAFILALWLADVVNRQVNRLPGVTPSFKVGVSKFSRFLLMTLAFLLALNAAGINLSSLAIFGGALGVGLGFGLQRIASNFISGFILVLDRSIKPGDVITVGDKFGWVQELNARYIVVRNREGVDTLIPNENLITSEVINWSYADPNVRVIVSVQISYDDDPEQAMQVMMECASASPRVLSDPAPTVRLIQFADSGIELQLRFWIADPANGFAGVKSDIHVAIWRAFKREGITIPYPQRDLHIKSMPARN
jgi:small-conductance mechanosensitive channel